MKAFFLIVLIFALGVGIWSFRSEEPVVEAETPVETKITASAAPVPVLQSAAPTVKPSAEPTRNAPTDFQQVWDMISDGRKEDAIALLQQMVKENPRDEEALTELGVILAGDSAQAAKGIEALAKALELNPENDRALGDILFTKTSPEERAKTIEKLKGLQPANPDSSNLAAGLGRLLLQHGDREGAVKYLEKGSADPKFAETSLSALIDTYRELGQNAQSASAYERLIAEQERKFEEYTKAGNPPKGLEGRILSNKLGLAAALIDLGQLDNADRILRYVRERAPDHADLSHLMQKLSQKRS